MKTNIYNLLGGKIIADIITIFYQKAVSDPIIGHFFFDKDITRIIKNQIDFSCVMLGDRSRIYKGLKMNKAHKSLQINTAHFNRRQVILKEAFDKVNLPKAIQTEWVSLELKFKDMIVKKI